MTPKAEALREALTDYPMGAQDPVEICCTIVEQLGITDELVVWVNTMAAAISDTKSRTNMRKIADLLSTLWELANHDE